MAKPDPFEEAVKAVEAAQREYEQRVENIRRELAKERQERHRGR